MDERLKQIYENVKNFPKASGVYIMRNDRGKIIYVGKAKILRKRVSDYFLKYQNLKTDALLTHISSIDYIVTSSEYEALILENNLIKKHKPHYNIDLKDDKTYAMIKITNEDYPKVFKTRRKIQDGSKYFGPFPKAEELDVFLKIIEDNFKYRRCKKFNKKNKPCLYYHIGKCPGPCFQDFDKLLYRKQILGIEHFLNGDNDEIKSQLESQMRAYAKAQDFENALIRKNQLDVINNFQSLQAVGNISENISIDYIGSYAKDDLVFIYIMQYRNSNLLGSAGYFVRTIAEEEDVFFDFLLQYYTTQEEVPQRIEFTGEYNRELLCEYFAKKLKSISASDARSKKDFKILELAKANARESYEKYMRKKQKNQQGIFQYDETVLRESVLLVNNDNVDRSSEGQKKDFKKFLLSFSNIGEKRSEQIMSQYTNAESFINDVTEAICYKTGLSPKTVERIKSQIKIDGKR